VLPLPGTRPALLSLASVAVALLVVGARAASGPEVDVSRLAGPQDEASIAIDPGNPRVLLAGSNSSEEGVVRIYESSDGGTTWKTETPYPKPSSRLRTCAADPWGAIDLTGRQYFSFVRATPCRSGKPRLYVTTRAGADSPWATPVMVSRLGSRALFDDKPSLAVDTSPVSPHRNRVYAAWSRISKTGVSRIVISYSDDGGRRWSPPITVNREGKDETYATVALARNGTVYVAWDDSTSASLKVARSTDGGLHFGAARTVATFVIVTIPHCGTGIVIPAVKFGCLHPTPLVSVDASGGRYSGRVYVTYAQTDFQGSHGVRAAVLDARLRPLTGSGQNLGLPVTKAGATRSDQFLPASAVDQTDGRVWVCFYDTKNDPMRKRVVYSCTLSSDGGSTWVAPVNAATVESDETQPGAFAYAYGDYEGLAVANGVAHPVWTDSRHLDTLAEEIYTTRLTADDLLTPTPAGP
jgi:hypothetical protein